LFLWEFFLFILFISLSILEWLWEFFLWLEFLYHL